MTVVSVLSSAAPGERGTMVKVLLWNLLRIVFLLILFPSLVAAQTVPAPLFPLTPGTFWVYEGIVRRTTIGTNRVSERKVRLKMQVRKLVERETMQIASVSGFPSDLDWTDGAPPETESLIVQTKQGKLYRLDPEDSGVSLKRFEDPNDKLIGLIQEHDLFLEPPLHVGKKFRDPEGMAREDNHYCWFVESMKATKFPTIKGVPPGAHKAYDVIFRTNPDHILFQFVPGVGLTQYSYHHHGTVADTELHLVEFHAVSAAAISREPKQ
jgi:hypothetical protein